MRALGFILKVLGLGLRVLGFILKVSGVGATMGQNQ